MRRGGELKSLAPQGSPNLFNYNYEIITARLWALLTAYGKANSTIHRASEPERRMAELKSIFEQIDPDEEAAAIAEAEAELDAGKGVPHEKVREWLLKLARGEIAPPPCE